MTSLNGPAPDGPAPDGPRAGRGNGLPALSYVPLVEVDPRTAPTLLAALAEAGVAAYVAPFTGTVGGWLDVHLPSRPVDRLYVDAGQRARARLVVDTTLLPATDSPRADGVDEAAAFRTIVDHFHDTEPRDGGSGDGDTPPHPHVPRSDGGQSPRTVRPALSPQDPTVPPTQRTFRVQPLVGRTFPTEGEVGFPPEVEDEGHYEPPPAPKAPRLTTPTKWALCSMAFGVLLLVAPGLLAMEHGQGVDVAGVLFVLGGVATLIVRMHDAPPTDWRGPDDGAVV